MTNAKRKGTSLLLALLLTALCLALPMQVQAARGKTGLSQTKLSVTTGASDALRLTDAKSKAIVKGVTWKSSDKKIATVSGKGVVTGKKPGKVTVTAKYKGKTYKCAVTVKNASFKSAKPSIQKGKTYAQKLYGADGKAISKGVTWKSSDKKIATVNSKGVITGKKAGKATITAKYRGRTYKCTVTVKQETETLGMEAGQSVQVKLLNADKKVVSAQSVTWKSSDRKIATVDSKGVITGKKTGKATVTAKYKGETYNCTVTVKKGADQGKKWVIDRRAQIIYEDDPTNWKDQVVCNCGAVFDSLDANNNEGWKHLDNHLLNGESDAYRVERIRIGNKKIVTRVPEQGHWEKEWTLK